MPRPTNLFHAINHRLNPKRSTFALAALAAFCLFCGQPVLAVDPLPDNIEAASPEVQRGYLERMGRESLEEKLKVGQLRYENRIATRQAIYRQMDAEVANRTAEAAGANGSIRSGSAVVSFLKPTAIVIGCAVAMILVIQAWRRTALG